MEHYGTIMEALQERYGALLSVTEHYGALRDVTEALRDVTEALQHCCKTCRTLQKRHGALWSHYRTLRNVMEASQKRYGALRSITEHYKVLRDVVVECCGAIQNVTRALRSHYGTLRSHYGTLRTAEVTEHYGVLRDITKCYGSVTENYRFCLN